VGSDLVAEESYRPAVGDDVMDSQQEHVFLFGELQETNPQERTTFKIKGQSRFRDGPSFFFRIASSDCKTSQVVQR